jgi:hypothetical protein
MSLLILILREIRHRPAMFLLSVLAVAVAVGGVVASALLLERDRQETVRLLAAKGAEVETRIAAREAEVQRTGAELQDAIRKHMTKLGFNVLILPQEQDLSELLLGGTLSATMPEDYVRKLSDSGIVTVNHLLPMVTKRLQWPEREREVILVGTRGEVPILHRNEKKPLLDAVAPGQMVVGYELHQQLGLQVGEQVKLLEREFTVSTLHPQRGTADDVTIWIDLAQAQELLGLQNLIHGILALECECAGDRISQVRSEIQAILPGTQVVERYSQALVRAEARTQAAQTAEAALAAERAAGAAALAEEQGARQDLEAKHQDLARWLVPVIVVAAAAWIAILAWMNVRQRRDEIGILRAIGLKRSGVLAIFEGKAVAIGLLGGLLGVGGGLLLAQAGGPALPVAALLEAAAVQRLLWLAPLAAVFLAAVASWLPALVAANHDPALVLEGE